MIVIIDNYDSFTYNLYQNVATHYKDVRVFRNDKITVEEIINLKPSGIILSPGPGRPENAGICVELVKHLAPTTPILGVCLGHQAIAMTFGGTIVSATEIMHGKSSYVFHYRDNLFNNLALPMKVGRYHSLIVDKESLPPELTINAESEDETIMGIKHKTYPCYGIQFHPESILTPKGDQIITNFIDKCNQYADSKTIIHSEKFSLSKVIIEHEIQKEAQLKPC